jgi:hypothetical protein
MEGLLKVQVILLTQSLEEEEDHQDLTLLTMK